MSIRDPSGLIRSVLIVDDSEVQRNHAVRLCKRIGARIVLTASNGSDGGRTLRWVLCRPSISFGSPSSATSFIR